MEEKRRHPERSEGSLHFAFIWNEKVLSFQVAVATRP
jgi:hypothetical protein